jgi:beta-ribofuranosylaminobenzene 5'-phosphate synthase
MGRIHHITTVQKMAVTRPIAEQKTTGMHGHEVIEIDTPGRLHFTLIDLHGGLGRIDGGIGVALSNPRIRIRVSHDLSGYDNDDDEFGKVPARVVPVISRLKERLGFENRFNIELLDSIPKHIGLGSNTQLALAVTKAVCYLSGLDLPARELARLAGRGGTSGIGVATFQYGGLVMDAGHSFKSKGDFSPSHFSTAPPPPLLMNRHLPDNWYFVMTTPYIGQGLHGKAEADVFRKYCPIPRAEVERLSHLILMKLLPAAVAEDIIEFGDALKEIQSVGFKRIENDLQDDLVKNLYRFYYENDALGAGLSSFGPTTYALVDGEARARKLRDELEKLLKDLGVGCDIQYSNVDNAGAKIQISGQ